MVCGTPTTTGGVRYWENPDEILETSFPAVELTEPPDRRRRTPYIVTNISTLGEIHNIIMGAVRYWGDPR